MWKKNRFLLLLSVLCILVIGVAVVASASITEPFTHIKCLYIGGTVERSGNGPLTITVDSVMALEGQEVPAAWASTIGHTYQISNVADVAAYEGGRIKADAHFLGRDNKPADPATGLKIYLHSKTIERVPLE